MGVMTVSSSMSFFENFAGDFEKFVCKLVDGVFTCALGACVPSWQVRVRFRVDRPLQRICEDPHGNVAYTTACTYHFLKMLFINL